MATNLYEPFREEEARREFSGEGACLTVLSLVLFVALAVMVGRVAMAALEITADNQALYYGATQPVVVDHYRHPSEIGRKAPTLDEMDRLEHLRRVNSGVGIGQVAAK